MSKYGAKNDVKSMEVKIMSRYGAKNDVKVWR